MVLERTFGTSPYLTPASSKAISAFTSWLEARGHAPTTIRLYAKAVRHLLIWLRKRRLGVRSLREAVVNQFVAHLSRCRCPVKGPRSVTTVRAAVRRFRKVTTCRRSGNTARRLSATERTLCAYRTYLRETCGLAESTCAYRVGDLREFLQTMHPGRTHSSGQLRAASIVAHVVAKATTSGPTMARRTGDSIRSYLRWMALQGLIDERVTLAIPCIPRWRLAEIPRILTSEQLGALLRVFDRHTPTGRRDYAMALCMAELGMRSSEVARLQISDVDWLHPALHIAAAKSSRARLLPLPHRTGTAIADYLQKGRPASKYAQLFVRHTVPRGDPLTAEHVRGALRRAYARAGFPRSGPGPICCGTRRRR